jgi:hypothetical protein
MKRLSSVRITILTAALAAAALMQFSCDENPADEDVKLRIRTYSGDGQTERLGSALANPLVAKVTDVLGDGKAGISVSFSTNATAAHVSPAHAVTDANGFVSCTFQLGTTPGTQHVTATMENDSCTFDATAVAAGCDEESPGEACIWPAGHIFIATTGSSLAGGAGTVIIDYNPQTRDITKLLETTHLLDGISFSSRGELFASSPDKIHKVDYVSSTLQDYINWTGGYHISLEPNEGSVLVGLTIRSPLAIGCAPSDWVFILPDQSFSNNIEWKTLAVDPVTRDVYIISKFSSTNYALWRVFWDGRSPVQSFDVVANLSVGAATPAGMCIDSTGTVYIAFDGNDNWRRIVSVTSSGTVNYNFFNFYTYYGSNSQEAGRWGDIAYLNGKLYIIDTRNDRLVIISKHGTWLDEVKNTAFSRQLDENEHYAICALPYIMCF